MGPRFRKALSASSLMVLTLLLPTDGFPFETPTHQLVNERAASNSPGLDQFLRSQLGFLRGLDEPLQGRAAIRWIGLGGIAEDQFLGSEILGGLTRSSRHFHTPLRSWDRSGLSTTFESSVHWAQNPEQFPGGRASWFDARAAFFRALTAPTDDQRQAAYAEASRILGQLMHLVADLASPPHTRDDLHLLPDDFETFMSDPLNRGLIAGFRGFDSSILRVPTDDPVARVPIARIWDTDRYHGTNPDVTTGSAIGLAEFSSANFFSQDTISREAFTNQDLPLPALDRLSLGPIDTYPPTGTRRQYLSKLGDGIRIDHMVAEGVFFRFTPPFIFAHVLDDLVFQEYATHLLPRAIGYASGLLDYFFRGRIEIAPPDRFVYGLAAFQEGNTGTFTKLRFKVRNATADEAASTGQLVAVVQYRRPLGGADLIENSLAPISEELFFALSQPQTVTLTRDFQELVFDFSDSPLPTNSADLFLTVVYGGPLGLEQDAVMVGGKDLFEPDPLDRVNITDYDCFQGQLFPVVPEPSTRDRDGNGRQDLFGPWIERGQLLKTFSLFQFPPTPSESQFDFLIGAQTFAQFARFMLLQDQPFYGLVLLSRELQETSTGGVIRNNLEVFVEEGILNRVFVGPGGELRRHVTLSQLYRGVRLLHAPFRLSSPNMVPCFFQTFSLPPDLTRIEGSLPAE